MAVAAVYVWERRPHERRCWEASVFSDETRLMPMPRQPYIYEAWVCGGEAAHRARVRPFLITKLVCYDDGHNPNLVSPAESLRRVVAGREGVRIACCAMPNPPFWVTDKEGAEVRDVRARVRVCPVRLADCPDVQAYQEDLDDFDERGRSILSELLSPQAADAIVTERRQERRDAADETAVAAGMTLIGERAGLHAVVQLRLNLGESCFEADITTCGERELAEGDVLGRRVSSMQGRVFEANLVEIVAMA